VVFVTWNWSGVHSPSKFISFTSQAPTETGSREMQNRELAADYVRRAKIRLRALDVLYDAESWADVVRESQAIVEFTVATVAPFVLF
jgi:hypothetical protein